MHPKMTSNLTNITTDENLPEMNPEAGAHLDQEVRIGTERIIAVLSQAIKKLQFAVCMPLLLKDDANLIKPYLTDEEITQLLKCHDYSSQAAIGKQTNHLTAHSVTLTMHDSFWNLHQQSMVEQNRPFSWAAALLAKTQQGQETEAQLEVKYDAQLSNMVTMLHSKPEVCMLAEELRPQISAAASSFLWHMEQLLSFVEERLSVPPHVDVAHHQYLRHVWRNNEKAKEDIEIYQEKLDQQRKELSTELLSKNYLIHKHEIKIERLKKKCKDDMKKRVNESERNMVNAWKNSEVVQETIRGDVESSEHKLQDLMKEHLNAEKDLRARKYKAETQLATSVAKYDQDIGQKHEELEEITNAFNEEKAQMEALQEQFDIQDAEYQALMAEKAREEMEDLACRMYAFRQNRAARKIQRYWRAYRLRKLARKKGRKKKK